MIELDEVKDKAELHSYYTKDRIWAILKNGKGMMFLYKLDAVGFYQYQGVKDENLDFLKNCIEKHSEK